MSNGNLNVTRGAAKQKKRKKSQGVSGRLIGRDFEESGAQPDMPTMPVAALGEIGEAAPQNTLHHALVGTREVIQRLINLERALVGRYESSELDLLEASLNPEAYTVHETTSAIGKDFMTLNHVGHDVINILGSAFGKQA